MRAWLLASASLMIVVGCVQGDPSSTGEEINASVREDDVLAPLPICPWMYSCDGFKTRYTTESACEGAPACAGKTCVQIGNCNIHCACP
jgi:hypothetical protein